MTKNPLSFRYVTWLDKATHHGGIESRRGIGGWTLGMQGREDSHQTLAKHCHAQLERLKLQGCVIEADALEVQYA